MELRVLSPVAQPSEQLSPGAISPTVSVSRNTHICLALLLITLACPARVAAQTDEIQVYTGELADPGKYSLTLHINYTPRGAEQAAFQGGVIPVGSTNGALEWARGVSSWFEAGAYLPVYSVTRSRHVLMDGVKLRALFAQPHADTRSFFYGVNFELSYNSKHWDVSRYAGEIRPILGVRARRLDVILNPILDTSFDGPSHLDFAPALRVAFNATPVWALAIEHYADFGQLRHLLGARDQEHNLFGVADYAGKFLDVEVGVGFGLNQSSDGLVLKSILAHTF